MSTQTIGLRPSAAPGRARARNSSSNSVFTTGCDNLHFFLACGAVPVNDTVRVQDAKLNSCKQIFHPFINIAPSCFTIDEGSRFPFQMTQILVVGCRLPFSAPGEVVSSASEPDGFVKAACAQPMSAKGSFANQAE